MAIIYTYPTKAFPTSEDLVLISDAADGNKTKNAKISSIQSLVSGVNSVNGLAGAVLLDAASSNLVRTTTPSTNTISYDLASSPTVTGTMTAESGIKLKPGGSTMSEYEEGSYYPWVQYCIYNQSTQELDWFDWGGSENTDWYNQTYESSGNYVKSGKILHFSFRSYPRNQSSQRFMCNGIRIKLPFNCKTGSLAKGFTAGLSHYLNNTQGIDGGWVSGGYLYMLVSQIGLTETSTPNTYENIANSGLSTTYSDSDQIVVTGVSGQVGTTTTAFDDKFRYPSSYWSTYGRATRYSFKANSYNSFSFGGTAYLQ